MIDVMHVITGLGMGGAETMLVQLTAALQARGLSQHVVSLKADDARAGDVAQGVGVTLLRTRGLADVPRTMWALARMVNRMRPRIIQGWMYHGNLAASLAHNVCAGKPQRKLFWNLRASNMDAERYGGVIRGSARLSRQVDVVIANSEAGIAFHRGHGFRPRRFALIDNGIDIDRFKPSAEHRQQVRAELAIPNDAIVVLHMARVDPMKDHATFLAAMQRLPSVVGILAGDGTQDLPLPPNARALGLRRDTEKLFAAADIVASTSAFGEGFSNVIAEGMSAGLVPVVTDVGDARRIVGETGTIVPPRDPGAFAQALAAVVAMPGADRIRCGLQARDRIVSDFTVELAVSRYLQNYSANSGPQEAFG
jgi:glycosyltransferase involved in cell wall biosynthesis